MKKTRTTEFYQTIVKRLLDFEIERIERLITQVEIQTKKDRNELDKIFKEISKNKFESDYDYDSYVESLADENYFLNDVKALAYQLAVISLYSLVEITSVREVSRYMKNEKDKNNLYKISFMKNILLQMGINLSNFKYYDNINELRLINNAIKHSGKADTKLKRYGWKDGDKFNNLTEKVNYFIKVVPEYMNELMDELDSVVKQ